MTRTSYLLLALLPVVALAGSGCRLLSRPSSVCPTTPPVQIVPAPHLVQSRLPCLSQPPPEALATLQLDPDSDGGLTVDQQADLAAYAAAVTAYSWRAWRLCGQPPTGTDAGPGTGSARDVER